MDFRYALSHIVPVPMRSTYEVIDQEVITKDGRGRRVGRHTTSHHERASWWQWAGHIFRHRIESVSKCPSCGVVA